MTPRELRKSMRRKWKGARLLVIATTLTMAYLGVFTLFDFPDPSESGSSGCNHDSFPRRHLLEDDDSSSVNTTEEPTETVQRKNYPKEVFTKSQLKDGAVILHIFGVIYMFIALAIVCDEFFVPALEIITFRLKISEDVAGATFMAAGGSAPELFTSFIGVFIEKSDVGIGTIVGSAVFNILFVIGMCALVSKDVLTLTWWPLFRDVTFYSISLICLINFYVDQAITWWEALVLLSCYAAYVIFMKFNRNIEYWMKSKLSRNQVTSPPNSRSSSVPHLKSGSSGKFRHGVLQLMIHTIDPLGEAKVHEKALKLHAIASLKVIFGGENHNNVNEQNQNNCTRGKTENGNGNMHVSAISNGQLQHNDVHRNFSQQTTVTTVSRNDSDDRSAPQPDGTLRPDGEVNRGYEADGKEDDGNQDNNQVTCPVQTDEYDPEELDLGEPLDLSWPDTCRKRLTYILLAPIIYLLWLTLPDVRKPGRRKYFPWCFLGSIIAIAMFSYLMNWWTSVIGATIGIPEAVMGLTLLAAGTSIPDLITSVIVAKKGYGDMAVSSSVGSNIFDVTVGLPLPWILYALIEGEAYKVSRSGLLCSIVLLFLMLVSVVIMIAIFKWKMNKMMGVGMFACYTIFITVSLLLQFDIIGCPEIS